MLLASPAGILLYSLRCLFLSIVYLANNDDSTSIGDTSGGTDLVNLETTQLGGGVNASRLRLFRAGLQPRPGTLSSSVFYVCYRVGSVVQYHGMAVMLVTSNYG